MIVIAVANQKGGVAKTTTAVNLAAGLAAHAKATLLIDLDAQANATQSLTVAEYSEKTTYEVLNDVSTIPDTVQEISPYFHVMPSHIKLAKLEPQLQGPIAGYKLRSALEGLPYDYVIIDCPPSLGALTTNALVAATHVLVPVTATYYGLNAVADFMETFSQIRKVINPRLELLGVMVTIFDGRLTISRDVLRLLQESYGSDMLDTVIYKNVRLDEAASGRSDIFSFDSTSRGAQDYRALLEEVLKRVST